MSASSGAPPTPTAPVRAPSDIPFYAVLTSLGAIYVVLILLLILADSLYTTPAQIFSALGKPEIRASILLTLKTSTLAAFLSLWIGLPLAYLLARHRFPGRFLIDALVDIPIVLPPLVLGLSLLILFHLPLGPGDGNIENWLRNRVGFPVTYHVPAIVLAQFTVGCAFVIRTLRVAFEQIDSRLEDVARTLGCTRWQSFLLVLLPQSGPAMLTAFTLAWARALGEFGPILIFAGTTRMRTEVLSTSVFLELGTGNLEAAVAVSLLMVGLAILVLLVLRASGSWWQR